MKKFVNMLILGIVCLSPLSRASADVTFGVDTGQTWLGFMNVFELPENLGGYVFSSGWGTQDLVAVFNAEETALTLAPNSVNDPNPFWYTPSGGPGSTGNKITDANFYVEHNNAFAGETVTFQGNVLSNTLTSAHTARVFIRDFAPNYSTFTESTINLAPGPFSISLLTDPGAGRHVQYGFNFNGPCVWITDVAPFGTVQIEAIPSPEGVPGDFDGDLDVDGRDFLVWQRGESPDPLSATDLVTWQGAYGAPLGGFSSVPEPAGLTLLVLLSGLLASRRSSHLC